MRTLLTRILGAWRANARHAPQKSENFFEFDIVMIVRNLHRISEKSAVMDRTSLQTFYLRFSYKNTTSSTTPNATYSR